MAERIEIVVTTDADKASAEIENLADQVEELTGVRPEITVAADTSGAVEGFAAVDDAATSSAGSVSGATKDMADSMGLPQGPISEVADAFAGLADTAVSKMGLSAGAVAGLAGALPLIGVGIGVAASAWDSYQQAQEASAKAAEEQRKAYLDVADALSAGEIEDAASKLVETTGDLRDLADDVGVSWEDLAGYITGATDALPKPEDLSILGELKFGNLASDAEDARNAFSGANTEIGETAAATDIASGALDRAAESLGGAAGKAAELAGYLSDVNDALDAEASALDVADAFDQLDTALSDAATAAGTFGANSEEASDKNRDLASQLNDAKSEVVDYAEKVGGIPQQTITEILAMLDQGKIAEAEAAFAEVSRNRDAYIAAIADTGVAEGDLTQTQRDRISTITADPNSYTAEGELNGTARGRISEIIGRALTGDAEAKLSALERTRYTTLIIRAVNSGAIPLGPGDFPGGRSAAPPAAGVGATPYATGYAGLSVAPQVNIRVDARGAIDPYSVGRAVEQAAGAWGRVSGSWRPGLRAVRR